MNKSKFELIREKRLRQKANENFEIAKLYQNNPIKAKFEAFRKTKSLIDKIKDIF